MTSLCCYTILYQITVKIAFILMTHVPILLLVLSLYFLNINYLQQYHQVKADFLATHNYNRFAEVMPILCIQNGTKVGLELFIWEIM